MRGSFSAHLMCSTYVAADSDLKHFLCWIQVALILYSHAIHTYAFHLHMPHNTHTCHLEHQQQLMKKQQQTLSDDWSTHFYLLNVCQAFTVQNMVASSAIVISCCLVAQLCPFFVTPRSVARQAPLSMGFLRQGYWRGLPFSASGIKSVSPILQADSLPPRTIGEALGILGKE